MANLYELKKFDLNLLVIFECIYQHLSISKAAETLYITPSAVSQSLQKLRVQLNDPLFIRSGKGITPTVVCVNFHHHLENNLNSLEQTINIMHESALKKRFVIYSPQILMSEKIMDLIKYILKDGNVEIEHHDIFSTQETVEDLLAYRKADLVLSLFPVSNRSIVCTPFKSIKSVLVCSKNHPRLGDDATIEQLLNEQFTLIISEEPGLKEYQTHVSKFLMDRTIAFRSESFITIINMIADTDIIGFVPKPIYDFYQPLLSFREVHTSLSLPSIQLYCMYNRASLSNKGFAEFILRINEE